MKITASQIAINPITGVRELAEIDGSTLSFRDGHEYQENSICIPRCEIEVTITEPKQLSEISQKLADICLELLRMSELDSNRGTEIRAAAMGILRWKLELNAIDVAEKPTAAQENKESK